MKKVVPDPPSLTLQDAEQCDSLSLNRQDTCFKFIGHVINI